VGAWDNKVRAALGDSGYWFAPLSPDTGAFDRHHAVVGKHRETLARRNLEGWLAAVKLPYRSPHAFRHGHIHYGLEHAETMADFKAVSLNVMHSNIQITDAVYSRLSVEEVHTRVERLGKVEVRQSGDVESEFKLFQQFLEWRKHNK
jgi:integrase